MKWFVMLATTVLALLAPTLPVAAASNNGTSGLAISPAIQQLVLSPKATSLAFTVQLYNHTEQPLTLNLSAVDFGSLNETGGVAFLGNTVGNVNSQHGLSSYLQLGATTVTLAANATNTVTITVTKANTLAVGGHYAAILAQVVPQQQATDAQNRVTLNQIVSSLIFVETAGVGTRTLQLLPPAVDKLSFSLPTDLSIVMKATGNTQTVPRGTVTIGKIASEQPAVSGQLNVNSSLILPGSTRLLQTPLTGNTHPWWPGIYQATINYHYDGALGVSTYSTKFLYINPISSLILLGLAGLVLWVLRRAIRRKWWRRRRVQPAPAARAVTVVKLEEVVSEPVDTTVSEDLEIVTDPVVEREITPPKATKITVIETAEEIAPPPNPTKPAPKRRAKPKKTQQ